ncbi:lactate/malate dehydrogenase [Mrakia frigida]|uniref:malate dehydrogenase n=1 Tax=Mrakia frigida TaxID=29902 RepID=UPI003FCC1DCC
MAKAFKSDAKPGGEGRVSLSSSWRVDLHQPSSPPPSSSSFLSPKTLPPLQTYLLKLKGKRTKMVHAVVIGAAGGIGQPLSLLLKTNPLVTKLTLYDVVAAPGVAVDLSHIDTPAQVSGFLPPDGLPHALKGADIVVIPAGVPRKPGMTRDDLFKINAGICRDLAKGIAEHCPKAFVLVISNPVNSTVPVFAEVFKAAGTYDAKRLFGVTTLDVVRASTFVSDVAGVPTKAPDYSIPVIGGHSGVTIVPLLSQSSPALPAEVLENEEKLAAIVKRIQFGGDEVVEAKGGAGSATLSMAYAGAQFASLVIRASKGEKGLISPSYVSLSAEPEGGKAVVKELGGKELEFFSVRVELGAGGIEKILPIGKISAYEQSLINAGIAELEVSIAKGSNFILDAKL